jgi:hypothetical protein
VISSLGIQVPIQRVHDSYDIDAMLASAHLRRLNDCCLFLQAVTLPNYTSSNNGQRLDHSKLIWKPVILQQQYHTEWKFRQKAYQFLGKWHL